MFLFFDVLLLLEYLIIPFLLYVILFVSKHKLLYKTRKWYFNVTIVIVMRMRVSLLLHFFFVRT